MAKPAYERAGFATANAYSKANKASVQWSRQHSAVTNSAWDPKFTPEQKGSYFRAFTSEASGILAYNKRTKGTGGGTRQLRKFLVVDTKRLTAAEWDDRYRGLQ